MSESPASRAARRDAAARRRAASPLRQEVERLAADARDREDDDLRRAASREPLGSGLRPAVASLGDHARMLAALGREQDATRLRTVRRLIELERELGRGLER